MNVIDIHMTLMTMYFRKHSEKYHEKNIENDSNVVNIEPDVKTLKCEMCDFETLHSLGLKSYMRKMNGEKSVKKRKDRKS